MVMISRELRASFTSVGLADSTSAVSRSPLSLNLSNTPSRKSSSACGLLSVPAGRSSCSSDRGRARGGCIQHALAHGAVGGFLVLDWTVV